MARGRMISRTLGSSRRFASIADHAGRLTDFAQALYPLLVSHADDFGRLEGDAFTVKHRVFPVSVRRVADFQQALVVLHEVGLIARYAVDDNEYLEICQFSPHQEGLHKRTRSRFPEPPRDSGNRKASSGKFRESPGDSGDSRKFREIPSQEKGTEEKGTEENRSQIRTGGVLSCTEDGAPTGLSPPPADALATRAGAFCTRYRWTFYPEIQGVAYTPQQRVEVSDLESATRLAMVYTDEQLDTMARFFLAIPEERERMFKNAKRTITMLLNMAEPIAKKLWGTHAASA